MRFLKPSLLLAGMMASAPAWAETIDIDRFFLYSTKSTPCVVLGDTLGVKPDLDPINSTPNVPLDHQQLVKASQIAKVVGKQSSYVTLTARFDNRVYTEATVKIDGIELYKAALDGDEFGGGDAVLKPGTHTLTITYQTDGKTNDKPSVQIETEKEGVITPVYDSKRLVSLDDFLYGERILGAEMSPSGNYIIATYSDTDESGKKDYTQKLFDAHTGQLKMTLQEMMSWMPKSEKMWVQRSDFHRGNYIAVIDPATMAETVLATHIPEGNFMVGPTEDFLIYRMERKGPEEDKEVYRVIEPEDRQPGWRDRAYPAIYRFTDKRLMPLVQSKHNVEMLDITDDGTKLLLIASSRRITKRPTTLYSVIQLDLNTMQADTLINNDGFVSLAYYTPDARNLVVSGSPESFGRVGCTLPDDVIPSNFDMQLYMLNIADKSVRPLTREFNPSVEGSRWSRIDDKIYLTAEDRDKKTLYRIDPATAEYSQILLPENVIEGFSMPKSESTTITWWGQGENNPDGLYTLDTTTGKSTLIDRPSHDRVADIRLSSSHDWTFATSRGYTVYGVYYLPDNFDSSKSYPLIVNYYGGCSPSTRSFESRYPLHLYASLGYVVLQLQPSGATGFGQEWSARHVSTAGKGVAEDIIEATKQFCKEMPYVNTDKIGCIGASYGGFMTQYLQTQTDIFAAAISHAGISDHTSYWGEGYWGYTYSETSMGNDLPWTSPDLYVKQSPLFNADKITTPILFLHGDADTNVPVGESIQMFTALQRLGKESAMVLVSGQNHHITDFSKRKKWQDTIFAWFAKYLQDDASWWKSMYPDHNL